jgi:RNA polymerase sigma factor (sigma-70 family)
VDRFESGYRELFPYAYNVGWRFFGSRELAEDVAQETLTRAFVRWPRVSRHVNPEGWIVRTAINVAQEINRRRRPYEDGMPAGAYEDADPFEHPGVVEALGELSRRQREVFVCRHAFDMTVKETAEMLGMNESQVKQATHEASRALRRRLATALEPA